MAIRLDHGDRRARRSPRDQRHAVHRRDAGAADHLHGGGAARDRGRRRSTCPPPTPSRSSGRTSRSSSRSKPDLHARDRRRRRSRATSSPSALDGATGGNKDERIFLRADRSVPYGDVMAGDEPAARGRLSQGRAGRPRNGKRNERVLARVGSMTTSRASSRAGPSPALVVLGVHAGVAAYLLPARADIEIGNNMDVVTVELAPIDSTPDAVEQDVAPAPETMVESKAGCPICRNRKSRRRRK